MFLDLVRRVVEVHRRWSRTHTFIPTMSSRPRTSMASPTRESRPRARHRPPGVRIVMVSAVPSTRMPSGSSAASRSARADAVTPALAWPASGTVTRSTRRRAVRPDTTTPSNQVSAISAYAAAGQPGTARRPSGSAPALCHRITVLPGDGAAAGDAGTARRRTATAPDGEFCPQEPFWSRPVPYDGLDQPTCEVADGKRGKPGSQRKQTLRRVLPRCPAGHPEAAWPAVPCPIISGGGRVRACPAGT